MSSESLSAQGNLAASDRSASRGLMALPEGEGQTDVVQEKVNEYRFLVAPIEQAIAEMERARRLLQARTEDEVNNLSPALAALSETLNISTLDLLTARDRTGFLRDAVARAGVPLDVLARRVLEAGAGAREQLEALGLPESSPGRDTLLEIREHE